METLETKAGGTRRGAKAYLIASGFAQACALIRYTLLARLLGPEQLGLAATLILTSSFFESISDSGSDRFLIQDRSGNDLDAQKLVQLVYIIRGIATAAALAIFAVPLSFLYHTPALIPGFILLALSPLISGLLHLDMRRDQREHDFRSEATGLLASEGLSLAVTALAAWQLQNYTAAIFGLVTKSAVLVLVSHLRAHRAYRIGFSHSHWRRLAQFGAPLMANGVLLFVGSQGDRVLVGNQLGISQLGLYSAVLLLILYPTSMVLRYIGAVSLPLIAKERDAAHLHGRAAERLGGQSLILTIIMLIGFAGVAPVAIPILYGSKFAESALVVAMIGILQTARMFRVWPSTVALGQGRSGIVLAANLSRLVAFPLAFGSVALVGGLPGMLLAFIVGELIALALGIALLNRAAGATLWLGFDRFFIFVSVSAAVVGWAAAVSHPVPIMILGLSAISMAVGAWVVRRESETIGEGVGVGLRLARQLKLPY